MKIRNNKKTTTAEESLYLASQWRLVWLKFKKHKLARISMIVLVCFYLAAIFAELISPYDYEMLHAGYIHSPPVRFHFFDQGKFHPRPFVYGLRGEIDPVTLRKVYLEDQGRKYFLHLFVRGEKYRFWDLFEWDLHLFGVIGNDDDGFVFLLGTDRMGRDMFSRVIHGSRISLTIGIAGIIISLVIGLVLGGISGYFGGLVDVVVQRLIELVKAFPTIPLWMALSAAIPVQWPPLFVYFGITIILSFIGWTEVARVVRGKILSLREEDYIMSAKILGCTDLMVIRRHLIPGFLSYIIVAVSIAIPEMILGETALSFLGLGLRPPITSWGVLLKEAQRISVVALYPWLLSPVLFIIVTVLAYNFLGDGLRDAADPYK